MNRGWHLLIFKVRVKGRGHTLHIVVKPCKHNTDWTVSAMTIKLGTHTSYDKRMTPIYFQGHGQRSKINSFYIANYKVISLFKSPVGRILQRWRCFGIFLIGLKNGVVEGFKILFPVKFRWIRFSGFRGEVENFSANQRPGGHLVFPIDQKKNTNLVEGVEILLPVKFRWIPFSGFYREVENVSANQRQGRPSCFFDRPEKHKLGRGLWDLAS